MIKRLFFVALLLALLVPATAQEKFDSAQLGCSFTYPEGWVRRQANFSPFILLYDENATDPLVENFHLEVTKLSGNLDQSSLSRMDLMQLEEQFPEMKMAVSKDAPLGNIKDAHRFEFAGKHLGHEFKVLSISGYQGNTKYTLYFGAEKKTYDRHISKIEAAVRSFKATGK